MKTLTKLLAPALGAALAMGIAAPAQAQYYDDPRQFRAEIRQFEREIEQAAYSGALSHQNATWLSYRLQGVRDQMRRFRYNGFDDWEMSTLSHSMQIMRTEIDRRMYRGDRRGYRDGYGYRDQRRYRAPRYDRRDRYDRRERYRYDD